MKIVIRVNENVSISVLTDDPLGEKKREEIIKTHLHRTNKQTKREKRNEENMSVENIIVRLNKRWRRSWQNGNTNFTSRDRIP